MLAVERTRCISLFSTVFGGAFGSRGVQPGFFGERRSCRRQSRRTGRPVSSSLARDRPNTALHRTPPVLCLCLVGWLCSSGAAGERPRWAAGQKAFLMTEREPENTNKGPSKSRVIIYGLVFFFTPQFWFFVYALLYLMPHPHITPNTPLFLALVLRFQAVSFPLLFLLPFVFVYSAWMFFREVRRKPSAKQAVGSSSQEESWPPAPKRPS